MYNEYPDLIYEGLLIDLSNSDILIESVNVKEKIKTLFKKIKAFLSKMKQKFLDKLKSIGHWMKNIGPRLKDKMIDRLLSSFQIKVPYFNINNVINFFTNDINDILGISKPLNDFIKVLDYTFIGFDNGEDRIKRFSEDKAYDFYKKDIEEIKKLYDDYKYLADSDSFKYFTGFGSNYYDSRRQILGRVLPQYVSAEMILSRKVLDLDIKLINYITKCGFDKKIDEIIKTINSIEFKYEESIEKYQSRFKTSINKINSDIRFLCTTVTKFLYGAMNIISETERVCSMHINTLNEIFGNKKHKLITDDYMKKDKYNESDDNKEV